MDTNTCSHGREIDRRAQGFSSARVSRGTLSLQATRRDAMRMALRAKLDTDKASRLLQEGRMQDVLGPIMENLQPEAAYFYERGRQASDVPRLQYGGLLADSACRRTVLYGGGGRAPLDARYEPGRVAAGTPAGVRLGRSDARGATAGGGGA